MFRIFCLFRILKKKNILKDVWYNEAYPPTVGAEDAPAKPKRYTFWAIWYINTFPAHCFRLASLAENTTAQRSVVHLTFANPFWRSVPTCLVLLRTEAGGMPAFQSVAASR
jgi:hypothetical protein